MIKIKIEVEEDDGRVHDISAIKFEVLTSHTLEIVKNEIKRISKVYTKTEFKEV